MNSKSLLFLALVFITGTAFSQTVGQAFQQRLMNVSGNLVDTDLLRRFYQLSSQQSLWRQDLIQGLKDISVEVENHGLNDKDYWNPALEALLTKGVADVGSELPLTEAYLRLMGDLGLGRLEPDMIDEDIKFQRRKLSDQDLRYFHQVLLSGPQGMKKALEDWSPQHPDYKSLKSALIRLKEIRLNQEWQDISSVRKEINKGESDPVITRLKKRWSQYGYPVEDFSPVFDEAFDQLYQQYCADNNLPCKPNLSPKNPTFWRSMAAKLNERISQIEVSMERFRWLPRKLEDRHIFINIAFAEFRLYEDKSLLMKMKTVNGRPLKRTPVMKDWSRVVELNPSWSVPASIAAKAKLPIIQQDPTYLEKNNFVVIDPRTRQLIHPSQIDWTGLTKKTFPYLLRQNSGQDNTLGLVKFPLTNPWAIYMHDTNERELFRESRRLQSSGCVRLEKPMEVAAYLLKDQSGFSLAELKEKTSPQRIGPGENRIAVLKPMPVYMFYATAHVGENQILRFVEDAYGQDQRIHRLLKSTSTYAKSTKKKSSPLAPHSLGSLEVQGEAGASQVHQKVKAVRCDRVQARACDEVVEFSLNQKISLPQGSYMVGFENSIYPGWVQVEAGELTRLTLSRLEVPTQFQGLDSIKIYRDLTAPMEKNKLMFQSYHLGRSLFPQAIYDFGDYYVAGPRQVDYTSRLSENLCAKIKSPNHGTDEALEGCLWHNHGRMMEDLSGYLNVNKQGILIESWVTFPGDRFLVKHKRFLVAAPLKAGEFVSVFPGQYQISADSKNVRVNLSVGPATENYWN